VLAALDATGTNPSNADREYAERVAGGKKLSPEGLREVIRAAKVDLANSVIAHNQTVEGLTEKIPSAQLAKIEPFAARTITPEGMAGLEQMPQTADVRKALSAEDFTGYEQDPTTGFWVRSRRQPQAAPGGAPKRDWRTDPAEQARLLKKYGVN